MKSKNSPEVNYHSSIYWAQYNANPKNKFVTDCVVRAISKAADMDWDEVYDALYRIGKKQKVMLNDKSCYRKLLKELGFVECKQPRKIDNKRYTGREFCNKLAKKNKVYFVHIGCEHVVCIKNNYIWDTWDSTNNCIGKYWVKEL